MIERRRRFFLGCEGDSERSYGALLNLLAREQDLAVRLVTANLQPAGNPLVVAEKAIKEARREEANGKFACKAVLLDTDQRCGLPDRAQQADLLLVEHGFIPIWQVPNHEGFLLRHFPGQQLADPPQNLTMSALREQWPKYRKNMPAGELRRLLSHEHLGAAAEANSVLRGFLVEIGFLPNQ